jgi:peptidoglycan/LPS O-acetylase OafA/YrhL
LMTLEKCATAKEFLYRRWLRLFPAMLVCSVVIYVTAGLFSDRPSGMPAWGSLLPGLTFIEPTWWERMIGYPIKSLEGTFWSLYVEFKFYVFAAVIYYWRGRNALVSALTIAFVIALVSKSLEKFLGISALKLLDIVSVLLSFQYYGWFASGAAFYIFSKEKSKKWFFMALLLALASSIAAGHLFNWQLVLAASLASVIFAASTISEFIQKILSFRVLRFFGFISYPLYLTHENMMISMIIQMGRRFEDFPLALLPIPAIALVSGLAFLVAKYAEPLVKSILVRVPLRGAKASDSGVA